MGKLRLLLLLVAIVVAFDISTIATTEVYAEHQLMAAKPYIQPMSTIEVETDVEEISEEKMMQLQEEYLSTKRKACAYGAFKSYTHYKVYKNKSTKQYKLQHDKNTYTDEDGFRRNGKYYIVAVGSYYSRNVGDTFHVVMESGKEFDIMVGDVKQDIHTNETNCYCLNNGSVLEFIVDVGMLSEKSRLMGNVSYSGFEGNISYIY